MKKVLLVLAYVLVCIGLAFADDANDGGRYLVLSTARTKTLRAELDSALAQGYALIAGDPSGKILVLQKRAASEPHKYQVSDNIYQTIKKNEYKGYRVLPWSFSDSHGSWAAMLESLNEGDPQPEYKLATTAYTRNLQKDISEASAGGYRAVAMAGLQGQGALLVKMPGATTASASYELLATKKISTMEKEIAASAAKGFKVMLRQGQATKFWF